ncbi:MAG TPA: glycosyltransferase family 2 protein, partial [Anaerolineaceae bacterium]|nr:glycosyltransferase family 2 protein [Anaerolineaceae bacterium]
MPQISVILPTFNRWEFISRAVGSLLEQSFTDWELWIIDDGSTRDTPAWPGSLPSDGRIRTLRLAENAGMGAALNAGLTRAAGELIAYLPDDDLYY